MKVVIIGGSGFIGDRLTAALLEKGHTVTVIDRHPPRQKVDFVQLDVAVQPLRP